jgi:hypothetical protein
LWRHWFKPNGEGSLDAPLDHPPFPVDEFQFDQMAQELNVVLALGRALPGELVVFPQEGRQLQRLQVMRQQDLWRIGHAAVVSRKLWKFSCVALRAFEGLFFQAARSRGIGSIG